MNDEKNKEFIPSDSEDFIKTIESLLDDDDDKEQGSIDISSDESGLIEITEPEEEVTEQELTSEEFDEYESALQANLDSFFSEKDATNKENAEDSVEPPSLEEETNHVNEQESSDSTKEPGSVDSPDSEEEIDDDFPTRHSDSEEELIEDINASLAYQVNYELQQNQVPEKKKSKKWLLSLIPIAGIVFIFTKLRKDMPKWYLIIRIAVFAIFFAFSVTAVATGGKSVYNIVAWYLEKRMVYTGPRSTPTPVITPILSSGDENNENKPTSNPQGQESSEKGTDTGSDVVINPPRSEDSITNILLIGEDEIGMGGGRGNTDLLMIATLDTREKTIKLTSLMRDMLVANPSGRDTKINSIYQLGGIDLLYETIELNFEITLDGYMMVGFEDFETIVDNLGGVVIELSKEESDYLNTTNYISKEEYRNTVPGLNDMNGSQTLGYCRIRKVATLNNIYADFGRTSRQRIVLNTIFDKIKTKNLFELALILDACLPLVRTDIKAEQISDAMKKVVDNRITTLVQLRIPIDGTYGDTTYGDQKDLIKVNFPENIRALHEFIFGDYKN